MWERLDWQALRTCDALVEHAIADGAYPEALDHLVRGYQRVIVSFCRTQLGHAGEGGRAEEVAQEVFLAAYQSMPRFQRQTSLRAWLFAIARNRCLQERRNYGRRAQRLDIHRDTVAAAVHADNPRSAEEQSMSEEELERLRVSLGELRKWERELLIKRFCEGYTLAMLAQESAFWSESTIRNRLGQALEHLRKLYRRLESAHKDKC
jgi:RNA polymerase sigma-70 factor (ECF subfamily)